MRIHRRQCLLSLTALLFTAGCIGNPRRKRAEVTDLLAQPKAAPNTMQLEFATVTVVPYRNRLLQETWNQIDQQAIDLETRKILIRNGLRAGIAGQAIPPALRSLMKPKVIERSQLTDVQKEMLDQGVLEPESVMNFHTRLTVQPDRSRDLPLVDLRPELTWHWLSESGQQHYRVTQAASLIRITMSPLNADSVSMGVIPLVKHGQHQPQFAALDEQLAFQVDQTELLLDQARLSCHLRCGETLLVGPAQGILPDQESQPALGNVFFSQGYPAHSQTLVLMRLLNSNTTEMFG